MEKFNLITSYIFTAICNVIFAVGMIIKSHSVPYALTLCAMVTVISVGIAYAKSKFGVYDYEKYQSNMYLVYCMQLFITFVVVFIVISFMR